MSLTYQQRTPPMARSLRAVARACPDRRGAQDAFGGAARFFERTTEVSSLRSLSRGPVSTGRHLPHMAHEAFLRDCVQGWRMTAGGRPGLPQLARALLRDKGIDIDNLPPPQELVPQERAIVRAIMLTALRAESNASGARNAYHNPVHTAHVAVMSGYLTDLNDQLVEGYGRFVEFTIREKLLVMLAAFAHDIDHPGRPNPADDVYRNERAAIDVIMPIMRAAGMTEHDMRRVQTMILTTSPNGPHAYLKDVARAHAHREGFRHKPGTRDELAHLSADRELVQMAAILSDADLFASAGTGIEGSRLMARRLTAECRRGGVQVDFTSAAACKGFLQHVVGMSGFSSQAAMAGFNRQFRALVAANDAELKKARPAP